MRDAMPDAPVFLGLAGDVIAQARGSGRYPKVRWWGEMVNVLWERGDVAASMELEDQFDHLAHEHEIAIFCSFVMDNFDGDVHARMLPRLGQNHSHLIPVEDYARLDGRWPTPSARRSDRTRPASSKNSSSRKYPRRFRCRGPRRCSWRCARRFPSSRSVLSRSRKIYHASKG